MSFIVFFLDIKWIFKDSMIYLEVPAATVFAIPVPALMCHNPAFGCAGPLGLCLGVETIMAEETFLCVKMAVCRYVTFQPACTLVPVIASLETNTRGLGNSSLLVICRTISPHQVSCLALVSPIHQGSFITGRHQLDKRAIKTSGLFLYRSAPCSGSHKPLAVLWKCKVPTRPRSALEWMSQQAGSGLKLSTSSAVLVFPHSPSILAHPIPGQVRYH